MGQAELPRSDAKLIQIVDAAFAEAARKSGEWLLCRPGCTQCCHGVFAINQLDALRLRKGLEHLQQSDPARARRVIARVKDSVARLSAEYPGDPVTDILEESDEAAARFEKFANDEPCPVLDPETGRCDLYAARPMTCRVFGPPVQSEGGLGVCDLCFHGATPEQVASCEMIPDPDDLESEILQEVEKSAGGSGKTIVAFALHSPQKSHE